MTELTFVFLGSGWLFCGKNSCKVNSRFPIFVEAMGKAWGETARDAYGEVKCELTFLYVLNRQRLINDLEVKL